MLFIKVGEDGSVVVFSREEHITALTPYRIDDTSKYNVSMEKLDELKENTSSIKLGLTYKGTDTKSEQSQRHINIHNCHPALVDMYSTWEGRQYRLMTTRVELGFTIRDFEEVQYHLKQLNEMGFVEFDGELEELENYFV